MISNHDFLILIHGGLGSRASPVLTATDPSENRHPGRQINLTQVMTSATSTAEQKLVQIRPWEGSWQIGK